MVESNAFKEYQNKLLRRYDKRQGKIRNSWGSKYIFRSVPKGHIFKTIDEATFSAIIRQVNNLLADDLAKGLPVTLPYLGTFFITTLKKYYYRKDGKLHTNRYVNWKETHKLWYEDKDAERKGLVIRQTAPITYHLTWSREMFDNASFYKFRANRGLKAKLVANIRNDINILTYGK